MKDKYYAFPSDGFDSGMTLRDYFAAAALTGLLRESEDNDVAKLAYQFADAMMEARK